MNLAWVQPGPFELVIILVVVLLLFGGKKLPGLSRSIGRSLSEFKKGKKEGEKTIADIKDEVSDKGAPESEPKGDTEDKS